MEPQNTRNPIVIIGGGITGLSAAWELQQQGLDYVLLEASNRLGGKIRTERAEGFIIEGGADSFITQKPHAWHLCKELGLEDRLVGTNTQQRKVYVLHGGRLQPFPRGMRLIVPTDPDGLMESELLSEEGKRRMLDEPNIPPRPASGDESLASFIGRRFGQEALDVFGEPLLAGIYTGNPETLSMQATFPQYLSMEQKYGSVTAGTLETTPPPASAGSPISVFMSPRGGMLEMIETLQAKLTGDLRLGIAVERIEPDGVVYTSDGEKIEAGAVILTLAAHDASRVLKGVTPELAEGLAGIKTLGSATVSMGFKESELPQPLDGHGFVVTHNEPTHLRASTWSSTKWEGRAPEGYALIRVFFGGHRQEDDVFLPDEQLVALAREELQKVMGITATPVITRIFRYKDANQQYEVGHMERVARFKALCPAWLILAGSGYDGIGIPDCVRQGREAAKKVGASAGFLPLP